MLMDHYFTLNKYFIIVIVYKTILVFIVLKKLIVYRKKLIFAQAYQLNPLLNFKKLYLLFTYNME